MSGSSSLVSLTLSSSGKPVPAGINLPNATFSFKPKRLSVLDAVAASVKTLVVSWKEAAEINDSVWSEALVFPLKLFLLLLDFYHL